MVHAGPGLDLVMGDAGQDFIFLGTDMGSEVFAGKATTSSTATRTPSASSATRATTGSRPAPSTAHPATTSKIFSHDGIDGNDVFLGDGGFDEFIAEGGDDIMVGSAGRGKMVGMSGFDWATYKDNTFGGECRPASRSSSTRTPTLPQNAALDEYESSKASRARSSRHPQGLKHACRRASPVLQGGGTEGYIGSCSTPRASR